MFFYLTRFYYFNNHQMLKNLLITAFLVTFIVSSDSQHCTKDEKCSEDKNNFDKSKFTL